MTMIYLRNDITDVSRGRKDIRYQKACKVGDGANFQQTRHLQAFIFSPQLRVSNMLVKWNSRRR